MSASSLRELSQRDDVDRFAHKSGEQLALSLGSRASIGTVTSCVRLVRSNVSGRLKKHIGLEASQNDVIAHDERGYFLQDWITVQFADDGHGANVTEVSSAREIVPAGPTDVPAGIATQDTNGINPRQHWVLRELQRGIAVERVPRQSSVAFVEVPRR
ncbi:MAG: hypothetical protein ACKO38_20880 [Planctomycetota bacterium]